MTPHVHRARCDDRERSEGTTDVQHESHDAASIANADPSSSATTPPAAAPGVDVRRPARDWRRIAALAIVAAAVYAVILYEDRANPTFIHPIIDAGEYDRTARDIAAGAGAGAEPFWHPPLYAYLLAGVYAVSGGSIVVAKIVQAGLGVIVVLLTASVASRLFDERTGWIAGLIAAFWGPLAYFTTQLLAAGLTVLLNLLCVWLVLWAADVPSRWRWLVVGAAFGLAALALPNVLVFLGAVVLWLGVRAVRARAWRPAAHAVLLVGATAVVVAPATIRNYVVSGEFVPISVNGGINFHLANNPDAWHTLAIRPGSDWEMLRREPELAGVQTASGADRYFYRKGLRYLRDDPGGFVRNLGRKGLLLINAREAPRNIDLYTFRRYSTMLAASVWRQGPIGFPFGVVAPLALLGAIVAVHKRRESWWLVVYAIAYGASVVLFFVSARHRLPLIPVVAVFAAVALVWIGRALRDRRLAHVAAGAALVAAAALVVDRPMATPTDGVNFVAEMHHLLGQRAMQWHNDVIAGIELGKAVDADPSYADAQASLGTYHLDRGDYDEAVHRYQRAIALKPDLVQAHVGLGAVAMARHQWADAERPFREALRLLPVRHDARMNLAVALIQQQRLREAADELGRGTELGARSPEFRQKRAALLVEIGELDAAEAECRRLLSENANDAVAYRTLAKICAARGNRHGAVEQLERAAKAKPDDLATLLELADALAADGQPARATDMVRSALALAETERRPAEVRACQQRLAEWATTQSTSR